MQAYTLHGPVLRALEDAARHGANVTVELEKHPAADARARLEKENRHVVRLLRGAGVHALLADRVHAKEIQVDGTLFLDEKNWRDGDVVLCEDDSVEARSIPMSKNDALALEGKLLGEARRRDDVIVETETLGSHNAAYDALAALGRAQAAPRLLVSARDLRTSGNERAMLRKLVADGVCVRICNDSSKLAAVGDAAWLGSANATFAGEGYDMTDWGVRTGDATIVRTVRDRLENTWRCAVPFRA